MGSAEERTALDPLRWFRLWGLADHRLDLALSAFTLLCLLVSRFALLASGPWEWDETIFARGMINFDLAAHFPHPPGFPGLLALGHAALIFAKTPYEALQWVSALAGVLIVWPLAIIGRKVAPAAVATAAALLVVFLAGPWLYSVRGFSTTASLFFVATAAAVFSRGLEGRRSTWFSALVAAAFLIRPILLPTLGLLWVAGVSTVRPWRRIVPGLALAAALVLTAILAMVHLQGGWSSFVTPFATHATSHASRLHLNTRELLDLGLVKGVGGLAPAVALTMISLVGIGVWARRVGWKAAAVWVVVLTVTITQLILLQNRSYARYAVAAHLSTAPLIAGAASLLPPPVAAVSLLAAATWAASSSAPLLVEQHRNPFGAWQATLRAAEVAEKKGWAAIVEPEVHVFSSYWWHELERQGRPTPPMVLSPRAPEPWLGVDRPWVVATVHPHLYLPPLAGRTEHYGDVSDRMKPMTQRRFLSAELIPNPPLPVGQWWAREHTEDGTAFMWAGPGAELWLPPLPEGSMVAVRHRPMPGDEPLTLRVESSGQSRRINGRSNPSWSWFPAAPTGPTVIRFDRRCGYPPGGGDDRPLAAQILGVKIRPAGAGITLTGLDQATLEHHGAQVVGHFPAEEFRRSGPGFWLESDARIEIAVNEPGVLRLSLSAPRPTDPRLRVTIGKKAVHLEVKRGAGVAEYPVEILETEVADGRVGIRLTSEVFVPSSLGRGSDHRKLGVVLHGFSFEPHRAPEQGWW